MRNSIFAPSNSLKLGGLTLVLSLFLALIAAIGLSSPAQAYTYDRTKAVTYAKKYSCNRNTACRNASYRQWTNDCTNFVSQAVNYGGLPENQPGSSVHQWFYNSSTYFTQNWVNVSAFVQFMTVGTTRGTFRSVKMSDRYTAANRGDLYLYDWGRGNGYSHLSMSTGYGEFVNYYDTVNKKNYNSVTGGWGDKMAQHSTDRDGAPWNWGYWTEKDPLVRSKMRTKIIHINS